MVSILADGAAASAGGSTVASLVGIVLYIVIFGVAIYFLMVKPQKKEQQKMQHFRIPWRQGTVSLPLPDSMVLSSEWKMIQSSLNLVTTRTAVFR